MPSTLFVCIGLYFVANIPFLSLHQERQLLSGPGVALMVDSGPGRILVATLDSILKRAS